MTDTATPFQTWAIVDTWHPVVGFEAVYEVSDQGQIRRSGRAARNGAGFGGGARIGRLLEPQPSPGRYLKVQLWRDGKPYSRLLHCLVAAAFLGPCPAGHEVNHADGDKHNNAVANLEYMTRPENLRHAYHLGLRKPTTAAAAAKRRKPRREIPCGCGCGTIITTPNASGRDKRYAVGHAGRTPKP